MRLRSPSTDSDQHASHASLRGDASVWLVLRSAIQGAVISYRLMILWDSGLPRAADVRRELLALLHIRDSYERQGQLPAFPMLLVLAPDVRRAVLWQAQSLRLATERWLTHPLLGGALAFGDSAPLLPFLPATTDSVDPWRTTWRSFAQPGAQRLNDILQAGGTVGVRLPTQWQTPWGTGRLHSGVEVARLILRLDARSLRLLTALYLHPLLSAPHLAVVLGIQQASAERMLRRLRRLDLVQTQTWNSIPHCALSDPGVLLLARCAHLPGGARAGQMNSHPPRVLRRYQREIRALARTPDHTDGVYSFFIALSQSCNVAYAKGHDAKVLWWETGARCARAFHDVGEWQVIRPDGVGEWQVEGQRFSFWLEWDRGTMGPRDLTAKFSAYARYLQSGEWRVDGNEPLPALLIVTTDVAQEARLLDALDATLPDTRDLSVYLTQGDCLIAHGPLAPVWRKYERWMGRSRWSAPRGLMSQI